MLTVGAEFTDSKLDDPASNTQGFKDQGKTDAFNGISATRGSKASQRNWAAYVEGNISLTDKTHLIPAIRFDHNSDSGSNWSPALNFSHQIGENWLVKGGVARAYKAPNLYQTNPDFILYTRGQGCPLNAPNSVRCYYMGNSNLKPETSINKEIGLEFNKNGWQASATYFHNAYRNKIVIGDQLIATSNIGNWLLQWENTPKATISGIEGNLVIPLHDTLKWSNNFTYMHKSEDYQGNPLSLVPKHTINSTLSWTPNERFDANLTFTHYGRTKPRAWQSTVWSKTAIRVQAWQRCLLNITKRKSALTAFGASMQATTGTNVWPSVAVSAICLTKNCTAQLPEHKLITSMAVPSTAV